MTKNHAWSQAKLCRWQFGNAPNLPSSSKQSYSSLKYSVHVITDVNVETPEMHDVFHLNF